MAAPTTRTGRLRAFVAARRAGRLDGNPSPAWHITCMIQFDSVKMHTHNHNQSGKQGQSIPAGVMLVLSTGSSKAKPLTFFSLSASRQLSLAPRLSERDGAHRAVIDQSLISDLIKEWLWKLGRALHISSLSHLKPTCVQTGSGTWGPRPSRRSCLSSQH